MPTATHLTAAKQCCVSTRVVLGCSARAVNELDKRSSGPPARMTSSAHTTAASAAAIVVAFPPEETPTPASTRVSPPCRALAAVIDAPTVMMQSSAVFWRLCPGA